MIRGLAIPLLFAAVALLPGPVYVQASETDDLQQRLTAVQAELDRQRDAMDESHRIHEQQIAPLRERRAALADEAVQLELRRRRLQRASDELEEQLDAAEERGDAADRAWRRVDDSAMRLADRVDLHLGELPGSVPLAHRLDAARRQLGSRKFEAGYRQLADVIDLLDRKAQSVGVESVELRAATGRIEQVELLNVGHVAFAYRVGERIGLALASPADATGYRWREDLPPTLASRWREVFDAVKVGESDVIDVPLDVTGRISAEAALDRAGLADRFVAGGPVMWPLAGVALLCAVLLAERAWMLYVRNGRDTRLARRVTEAIRQGEESRAAELAQARGSSAGRTVAALLARRHAGQHAMEDSVQEQLLYEMPRLQRFLRGIGILAAVAPLLGLLGTVTGIIETFNVIQTVGDAAPKMMAGGIGEALVTTATGLVIAVPVLLINGLLRGRVDRILAEAEEQAAAVLNVLAHDRPTARHGTETGDA